MCRPHGAGGEEAKLRRTFRRTFLAISNCFQLTSGASIFRWMSNVPSAWRGVGLLGHLSLAVWHFTLRFVLPGSWVGHPSPQRPKGKAVACSHPLDPKSTQSSLPPSSRLPLPRIRSEGQPVAASVGSAAQAPIRCNGLSPSPAANPGRIPSIGGDVVLSARPCTAERTAVAQLWADMEVISVHMHMFKC